MATGEFTDRLKGALVALIRRVTARYDYAAKYSYTVVTQDTTTRAVVLKPDRPDLVPALQTADVRWSNPMEQALIKAGARCLVGFANMDPSQPYVDSWLYGNGTQVTHGDPTNARPIARMGDMIRFGGAGMLVNLYPMTGVPPPPDLPVVAGLPHWISFGTKTSPPVSPLTDLIGTAGYGIILTGSEISLSE
jgi:hypothetical protein